MKNNIIIIIATILVVAFFVYINQRHINEIKRLESNQQSMLFDVNKSLKLNSDEIKVYLQTYNDKLLRRMSDSLKVTIKPKNITHYNTTNYTYKDTNVIEVPLIQYADVFPFELKDSCLLVSGYVDVVNNKLIVENRELSDNIVKVNYVKRKPVKWLFGLRVGKKQAKVYLESRCGKVTNTEIEVVD